MKTNHYSNEITSHLVTIIPMTPFTLKSTSKLRFFLHFRYSIVILRFIRSANTAQLVTAIAHIMPKWAFVTLL